MSTSASIRVVLADDHELIRDGIKSLLEDIKGIEVVGEAADGAEALDVVAEQKPDLLIVDIRMPNKNGIEAVRELTARGDKTRALVLSMHDSEDYVLQSVEAGAYGYILKGAAKDEFLKAIRSIYQGEKYFSGDISQILVNKYLEKLHNRPSNPPIITPSIPAESESTESNGNQPIFLTKREIQILKLAISGLSNNEIADQLDKSVRTVEAHRYNLMKKLKAKNLMELSLKARELKLF
ncbi:response regulator [Haliscomenobacter sp.]|uniref:response regulator n=1 Tax=Haliscomenobacter sp. TaxID=2717303 RepID=UPI003BAA600D